VASILFTYLHICIFTAEYICDNILNYYIINEFKGDTMAILKDDTKDQIPLFELPAVNKERLPAQARKPFATAKEKEVPVKKKVAKGEGKSASAARESGGKRKAGRGMEKVFMKSPLSGQVPEGDVRLTANIREDLHLKLKIAAARRRTTIGELLEEIVEKYI
jgi:hypothetical protein